MPARLQIHPGHGAGPFVVGLERRELRRAAGEPEEIEHGMLAGLPFQTWSFCDGQVEVRFDDADVDRASWIVISDPRAELAGLRLIGLAEDEFLATARRLGLGPMVLADDFGDGLRDYEWPAANLSFWISDGVVESITVMPFYDESGDVPLWPRDARIDGATT